MAPAFIKLIGVVSIEKWKVLQFTGAPNENMVLQAVAESLVIRKLYGSKLTFPKIPARKKAPENST